MASENHIKTWTRYKFSRAITLPPIRVYPGQIIEVEDPLNYMPPYRHIGRQQDYKTYQTEIITGNESALWWISPMFYGIVGLVSLWLWLLLR